MNTRLLRKVAKHIKEEPKRFIMGSYVRFKGEDGDEAYETENIVGKDRWKFPKCGTAACIGGWACMLTGNPKPDDYREAAKLALEIGPEEASLLFGVHNWPDKYRLRFMNGKTNLARVNAAVSRIEHFIKTKGRE